ncbi:MAG: MFS transporter [Anaerolineae bacterium]|nr:MFS transporter [Anaerolineae bacterium]
MAHSLNIPKFDRDIWLLCAASGLCAGAYLGLRQLLSPLYALRLGYGPEFVGSLSAASSISFAAASLPGGALGTRYGARRILILGAMITIGAMTLLPMAELVPAAIRSGYMILSEIVSSSGWSLFVVNVIASMAAFTQPTNRRGAFALREAFAGLGSFLGALVGGLLPGLFAGLMSTTTAEPGPYRYALWAAVVMGAGSLAPLAKTDRPTTGSLAGSGTTRFRLEGALLLLAAAAFANNAAHAACKVFTSPYMDQVFRLPTSLIGAISSAGMLLSVLLALSSPSLSRGRESGHMMILASLGIGACLLFMSLIPHWLPVGLGLVGVYGILAVWRPAFQALQMDISAPQWRSLVSGACATGMSLGYGSLSLSGGYVATTWGYPQVYAMGGAMAALSAGIVWILARRLRDRPAVEQAQVAELGD